MGYYKVKNITNSLAKRDIQKDKNLAITLNNGLFPTEKVIEMGDEFLIECSKLPTELQKLRVKGLVTIVEVGKNEFLYKLKESQKPKKPVEKEKSTNTKKTTLTTKSSSDDKKSSTSGSSKSPSKSTSNKED
jgi:hypothetical protein